MSDPSNDEPTPMSEDERLRTMVRGALRVSDEPPDVLAGFRKEVREQSEEKFYADDWSTARHPPVNTYLVTGLMMLLALAVIYGLLAELSGRPERVRNQAAPVNVVAPAP